VSKRDSKISQTKPAEISTDFWDVLCHSPLEERTEGTGKGKEARKTREYQLEPVREGARGGKEKGFKEDNEIHETF